MSLIKPRDNFGTKLAEPNDLREQYLFLLEFYVHRINCKKLVKLNGMFCVPTSIFIRFLNFKNEDIEVLPVDLMFQPVSGVNSGCDDSEIFYSGRSVIFALARREVMNKSLGLKVCLTVMKKMPKDVKPNVLVGTSVIDLSKHFAAVRKEVLNFKCNVPPPPKVLQKSVPLMECDTEIGTIDIYVAVSAFGQSIVTDFDKPDFACCPKNFVFSYAGECQTDAYKVKLIEDDNDLDLSCGNSDEIDDAAACQVCQPSKHICDPCGKCSGAVMKVPPSSPTCSPMPPSACVSPQCDNTSITQFPASSRQQQAATTTSTNEPCGKAVVLKVSGLLEDGANPTVAVTPESEALGRRNKPDSNFDFFVLRIGKKGLVGANEKSDLQLELKTPKGPERRPPIRLETREMQTEGGKKKGKKGKGGKKGKKKKK